jgi:hypothetical protein
MPVAVVLLDAPATTSSTAYTSNASATALNGSALLLEEIMGALEPDNDNEPLSMVG